MGYSFRTERRASRRFGMVKQSVLACTLAIAGCAAPTKQVTPGPLPPAVSVSAALPAALIVQRPESHASDALKGCFSSQIGTAAWAGRIAASVVHIHEPSGLGDFSGTGFVVRDSSPDGKGRNRIVTAGHVVDDIMAHGGLLEVASSSGVRIGYAAVVARPQSTIGVSADGRALTLGDLAVLEMRGFFEGGRNAYAAIEGMDLGNVLPRRQLEGIFSRPAGIVPGASGSPVLDSDGRAVGVLIGSVTSSRDLDHDVLWSANVRIDASDAMWYDRWLAKPGDTRTMVFPARSRSFAESLADVSVLSALGRAGAVAKADPLVESVKAVTVPGFPQQVCVVYRGDMYPAGHVPR